MTVSHTGLMANKSVLVLYVGAAVDFDGTNLKIIKNVRMRSFSASGFLSD